MVFANWLKIQTDYIFLKPTDKVVLCVILNVFDKLAELKIKAASCFSILVI